MLRYHLAEKKIDIVSDKQAISPKVSEFHTYVYGKKKEKIELSSKDYLLSLFRLKYIVVSVQKFPLLLCIVPFYG